MKTTKRKERKTAITFRSKRNEAIQKLTYAPTSSRGKNNPDVTEDLAAQQMSLLKKIQTCILQWLVSFQNIQTRCNRCIILEKTNTFGTMENN